MHKFMYTIIFVGFIIKVNTTSHEVESWTGKWFPQKPEEGNKLNKDLDDLFSTHKSEKIDITEHREKNDTKLWDGKWFPQHPIGKVNDEQEYEGSTKPWNGIWFPQKPDKANSKNNKTAKLRTDVKANETWKGDWFPQKPIDGGKTAEDLLETTKQSKTGEAWNGMWFPQKPNNILTKYSTSNGRPSDNFNYEPRFSASPSSELEDLMSPPYQCDNGKDNIEIDFDPENKRHSYKYLCLYYKTAYDPNYSISPLQRNSIIPPAYEAPSYCLNETIEYEERLPTFGAHRYISPKYGEYKYLPVQRWMHSLEKGAIVMLYHPCANRMEVEKLRNAVRACLYRHVITPYTLLTAERPLALVVWGTSIEMSVVHLPVVVNFIKENAKHDHVRRSAYNDNNSYQAGMLVEAKLVTDESDSQLCPNFVQ